MRAEKVEKVKLNNGVELPLIGLGTWDLRGRECVQTVSTAIDLGYRLIDTAQMYENEREVGEGIKKSGIAREQLFVTTKLYRRSNSYAKAKRAIEESLENLQLSYVDLLLLHEPYPQGTEMYRALEEALYDGKARSIGISNYDEKWYRSFIKQCDVIPAVNQLESHVFFQKWEFQEEMRKQGVVLQAWAPLAQGIGNVAGNKVLAEIGEKYQKSAAQIALRFLVQRGIPVIPKTRHIERLQENMALFDFSLAEEDIRRIKELDRGDTLFPWTKAF